MGPSGLARGAWRWQVRVPGLVAGGLCGVGGLAAAAAPAPPGGAVTRFGGGLVGVAAASPSAAWAVGGTELNHHSATVLLRWDGKGWRRAARPRPGPPWAGTPSSAGQDRARGVLGDGA